MPTTDDTASSSTFVYTIESLRYAITHVFSPSISPSCNDDTPINNHSLARAVSVAARAYSAHVCSPSEQAQWRCIAKMLDNFQVSFQTAYMDHHLVMSQLREMQPGDILAYFIRPRNTAIVLTKQQAFTRCEAFEVFPSAGAVKATPELSTCSYPGSAIELSNDAIDDEDFRLGLAAFLSPADDVTPDLPSPSDSKYIDVLFYDILQKFFCGIDDSRKPSTPHSTLSCGIRHPSLSRVVKRVRKSNKESWLRSPLWLFIRVIIQMSDVPSLQTSSFKSFVLFFMCTLAVDENNVHLPGAILQIISSTIVRRFGKLGSSTPDWLSEMALQACTRLRGILDTRQKQLGTRRSPFQNPSQDELLKDTRLSLLDSRDYIRNLLETQAPEPVRAPFRPNHLRRGAIEDFLSSNGAFFDEAYAADPEVTIYDVERSVEEGIDDWLACVDNVDEACMQLEFLMDKYVLSIQKHRWRSEHRCVGLLTLLELFVALDKLVVRKIPMLADYTPAVPVTLLENLLLRTATSLHRLSCIYQYLSARHSQSRLGSVLSDNFTEDSFPVRYYDQSTDLQRLRARIEEDSHVAIAEIPQPLLPVSPLYAKVFVFELQCPLCIRAWRLAVSCIAYHICRDEHDGIHDLLAVKAGYTILARSHAFRPYFVDGLEPQLRVRIHFAYHDALYHQSPNGPVLHYIVEWPRFLFETQSMLLDLSIWKSENDSNLDELLRKCGNFSEPIPNKYMGGTVHSPNDVLSAQTDCPTNLSLHEFIAFAHLRSGGTLQWLNLLQGLHNRTISFRSGETYFLLSNMAFEVGPLDLNTGSWIWHRELEDSSFCNALLDELEDLFMDVSAGSMDSAPTNLMALLLTRLLAPSASEHIYDRVAALLQRVRSKTFSWAQDILYDLAMAPADQDRWRYFHHMADTCRSTFHVERGALCKILKSPEDVDALLSCEFFMHAFRSAEYMEPMLRRYSTLLQERDLFFTPALEEILADVILADPTDYGIDLAVAKILASYHPGVQRWERLQHPNGRWLTQVPHHGTEAIANHSSPTVHINLLSGEIWVAGRPLRGLPGDLRDSREVEEILRDQRLFVLPSDLPGMDFKTVPTFESSNRQIHFSIQQDGFKLQVQCNKSTGVGSDVLALIPSSKLQHDLPPALVEGHVHWLNLSGKFIEIRSFAHIWEESPENWRIDCASEQYRMCRGCESSGLESLVDVRSPTWEMVHKSFQCINVNVKSCKESPIDIGSVASFFDSRNLVVTTTPASGSFLRLAVALPRLTLSFFVNEQEEFESCEFKDMVYDEDQSVGALFGLESLLVLRPKARIAGAIIPVGLIPRRVLLPNGEPYCPEIENHKDRNCVSIDPETIVGQFAGTCHMYDVDTELGCFRGNGSMESIRFLAHLHAMTNGWHHPDPLTGKTGIQTALCLLHSAACRSIMEPKSLIDLSYLTRPKYMDIETLFRWPQIRDAYAEVQERYYWDRDAYEKARVPEETHEVQAFTDECLHNRTITYLPPSEIDLSIFPRYFTLHQLFACRLAPELPQRTTSLRKKYTASSHHIHTEVDRLLSSLHADHPYQHQYLAHLGTNEQHARQTEELQIMNSVVREDFIEALKEYFVQCRTCYLRSLDILKKSLGPSSDSYQQAVAQSCGWPTITADILLRYLTSAILVDIPPAWQTCLTFFALLLVDLQRARRLLRFALDGRKEEFQKELENEGCDGWNPQEHPDWLLIQIEGDFLIRRSQAEAAMEVMSPCSGDNTVVQISMGEGKSSVIIPIAAAALADGKQLVRVVVPKPLTTQMFESLVARLGGLANRPIYYLPFSRSPEYDNAGRVKSLQIDDLDKLMRQCMAERGILLVQPEHVVSLKLMSVDQQLRQLEGQVTTRSLSKLSKDYNLPHQLQLKNNSLSRRLQWLSQMLTTSHSPSKTEVPHAASSEFQDTKEHHMSSHDTADNSFKWTNLQKWIRANVRDILDEGDEVLHSRMQLVYTLGSPQHLDGYPDRWTIIQQVLRLVKYHLHSLSKHAPVSVHYECSFPGSFPHVRMIRSPEIGRRLISLVTEDVMSGKLPTFNFRHLSSGLQTAIRSFISDENVLQIPHTAKIVEEYAKGSNERDLWSRLLLLRGLLTSNILLYSLLERRWRVDYGPFSFDPWDRKRRTRLAVPYRAKDLPAPNTQFGHPDLTIILTCLSYYYGGLGNEQLQTAFQMLFNQNDPYAEYALWISELKPVPDSLRELKKVNLRSWVEWEKIIFPHFTQNQATVDFYLSQAVFPKETKEFASKLSCSSWDLARAGGKLVTGFSGTTDGQWLLPTSIKVDPQMGTDARVLACVLRPEDNSYQLAHKNDEQWDTHAFLRFMATQEPRIRVLIDVGSQILDLGNHELARKWLEITSDAIGAVFFGRNDELTVLTRGGLSSPLSTSVLSQQLGRCVVYLDHAHTRGTDLKFPIGSRAAVMLGPRMTKDALIQGCMRMRKLGNGHSVVFFAPPKVDWSIRAVTGKTDSSIRLTTVDVLCWAIHETWNDIHQRAPHWAQQGMNYKQRQDAWSRFLEGKCTRQQLSDAWMQMERKSLVDLYAPRKTTKDLSGLDPEIQQRCKDIGVLSLPSAELEEEHEREVHREREREREVELPPKAEPAEHVLHQDVVSFVRTGLIPTVQSGGAFIPIFTTLERSSAATREADVWSPSILATADFCRTIKPESTRGTMDQYLRPVQWILSNKDDRERVLVLLSPFEVDRLMRDIRTSDHVHLHLYSPRMSLRMKPADDLKFYTIPPLPSDWIPPYALIDQLNVFAGQLYLRDYESCLRLCRFLNVPTKDSPRGAQIPRNLFNIPGGFERMEMVFSDSPLPFVMALLAVRTRGLPFADTHMGRILQGQMLTEKDFERPAWPLSDSDDSPGPEVDLAPPSPSSDSQMDLDVPDNTAQWKKRGLDSPEVDAGPSRKRLRTDDR